MQGNAHRRLLACLALCAVSFAASAQQTTYRVTHIWTRSLEEPHTNDEFEVSGINDRGQLSGHRVPGGAFVWHNGTFQDLNPPNSVISWATGINEWSDVSGYYSNLDETRAFVWRNGRFTPLAAVPGEVSLDAADLNNRREVLVNSFDPGVRFQTFVWHRGTVTLVENPPGAQWLRINDAGAVLGTAGSGTTFPVIWQDGAITSITLPGDARGFARDINDDGAVLIDASSASAGRTTTYVWRRGELEELPTLEGYPSTLSHGINNAGTAVGRADGQQLPDTAIVWDRGEVAELNAVIHRNDPFAPHVHLREALHINDRGEIVARGNDERNGPATVSHYLLTPRN
jgi:uncharacterized membrane protein